MRHERRGQKREPVQGSGFPGRGHVFVLWLLHTDRQAAGQYHLAPATGQTQCTGLMCQRFVCFSKRLCECLAFCQLTCIPQYSFTKKGLSLFLSMLLCWESTDLCDFMQKIKAEVQLAYFLSIFVTNYFDFIFLNSFIHLLILTPSFLLSLCRRSVRHQPSSLTTSTWLIPNRGC